jgi:hypothetical protein
MSDKRITRRQAIKVAGAAVIAGGVSGCGAVASAGQVVISVAWKTIEKVVSAIVSKAGRLVVKAIVAGVEKLLEATLSSSQVATLDKGAKLFLRTEDGVEHEIPFTIQS